MVRQGGGCGCPPLPGGFLVSCSLPPPLPRLDADCSLEWRVVRLHRLQCELGPVSAWACDVWQVMTLDWTFKSLICEMGMKTSEGFVTVKEHMQVKHSAPCLPIWGPPWQPRKSSNPSLSSVAGAIVCGILRHLYHWQEPRCQWWEHVGSQPIPYKGGCSFLLLPSTERLRPCSRLLEPPVRGSLNFVLGPLSAPC